MLNQGRINLLLATLAFTISSAGSVLLHIVFAVAIYSQTGSGLLTSLFVSLQWLPALLVVLYRSDWDHGIHPKKRWFLLDGLSALLTLPVLYFVSNSGIELLPIILILLIRGVIDQISRINKTVICRFIFSKEKSTHYASFMQTGYHFGIGLAAITGIFIADKTSLINIVLIDVATFVISAVLVLLIKYNGDVDFPKSAPRMSLVQRSKDYWTSLSADKRLLFCAVITPLSATFFQGTYSVLQPIFPLEFLQLDAAAVSTSYVLASLAIFVGSSSFSFSVKKYRLFDEPFSLITNGVLVLSVLAAAAYMTTVTTTNIWLCALCFTLMVFIFEFVWMAGYSGIVQFSPQNKLGSTFGISFAIGCLFGSVAAAATGYLLDIFDNDFASAVAIFMVVYLAIVVFIYLLCRNVEAPEVATEAPKIQA